MAILENVMQRLQKSQLNEYATYEPNQLLANEIGDHITNMGFLYTGFISEPATGDQSIPIQLDVELNADDVDVVMSENVMYCYLNSDKVDHLIKPDEVIYQYANCKEILHNNHFVPVNAKAWRDDTKLYLLKINLNSGLIGRYDIRTGRFRNQEVNWNSSTPTEVAQLLLPKEYLQEYLSHELCSLESYVSFITDADIQAKAAAEGIIN